MAKTLSKPQAATGGNAAPENTGTGNGNDGFVEELQAQAPPVGAESSQGGGSVALPGGELVEDVDDERAFEIMKGTNVGQLEELTSAYLKFDKTGAYFFKFTGMTTYKGDKGEIEAVRLTGEDGISYVAAQTVIVNSLKKVVELPAFVRIDYLGMKKASGGGNYADVKVFVFPHVAGK